MESFNWLLSFAPQAKALSEVGGLLALPYVIFKCGKAVRNFFFPFIIVPDDHWGIVFDWNGQCKKIHIRCSILNRSNGGAILNRVVFRVTSENGQSIDYLWHQFNKYTDTGVEKESDVHPIALSAGAHDLIFSEFKSGDNFQWQGKKYTLEILGWLNGASKSTSPHPLWQGTFSVIEKDFFYDKTLAQLEEEPRVAKVEIEPKNCFCRQLQWIFQRDIHLPS